MPKQNKALKLRICEITGEHIEQRILDALVAAGFAYERLSNEQLISNQSDAIQVSDVYVNDARISNSATDGQFIDCDSAPANYDCLLVDWRDANPDTAQFFATQSGREPVVALINSDQAQTDLSMIIGFNDFVCEQEIGLASFTLRLKRLVCRYRDPLSLTSTNAPEAQLLQTVVNHSSDWLFIKDLDHRFLAVSEEYASSLERSFDSVIGKNDLEIGFSKDVVLGSEKADWPGFWPQDDHAVARGEPTVETNPYWRVFTGDTRHRKTIRVPLKNYHGEVYALLVCSEDVTTIVKTEQVLRERSEMLEKVTQEKLKAEHSRLMAELAVTAKNKFIATASHDLRQPLHALGLYLDVLETKVKGEDEQALITKIKNSSNALSVLFNSLLDLSRLDAGVVEVEPVHFTISTLLSSLSEEFEEVAADKSLNINVEQSNAVLYTDAVLLERILRNLIQNAITYTPEGSVDVRCELASSHLRIDICDTGPGIPQIEQNAIFSEYYQLEHDGRRPTIGLGLGLAIVRRLVDLLDVKFDLQSNPGEGSVFSLELPLGDAQKVIDEVSNTMAAKLNGYTVLIIDDEADILDGMSHVLKAHGCTPVTAKTVSEAIEKLTRDDLAPSMIVADYRLQYGQTGDTAIELIREEFNSDIPAIIVTGDTSADRLKEATNSGFRLLHKPVQTEDLIAQLSVALSGRQSA